VNRLDGDRGRVNQNNPGRWLHGHLGRFQSRPSCFS
jgi:hypothetical protein